MQKSDGILISDEICDFKYSNKNIVKIQEFILKYEVNSERDIRQHYYISYGRKVIISYYRSLSKVP